MSTFHGFEAGGKLWRVSTLWERARDLPVFRLRLSSAAAARAIRETLAPLLAADDPAGTLGPWMQQAEAADIVYPVILAPDWTVMGGRHRLVRAAVLGRRSVPAVRFAALPPHDAVQQWVDA